MNNLREIEETIRTYENFAEDYSKKYLLLKKSGKKYADYFMANLTGKKILDIGCGPGRDLKYFSDHGFTVVGVDVVERFIELAKRIAPRARALKMDLRALDFPANNFDGVWMKNSLIHIPKQDAAPALRDIKKILKAGGVLYLSVKLGAGEGMQEDYQNPTRKRYTAFYDPGEIIDLLGSLDFTITDFNLVKQNFTFINILAINNK